MCKKNIKFIIVLVIYNTCLYSQDYNYVPFPDSNAIWTEYYSSEEEFIVYHNYALFNDDTIIKNKKYNKLFILNDTVLNINNAEYVGAIREDSLRRIYYYGKHLFPYDYPLNDLDEEIILYDFSVNLGDTVRDFKNTINDYIVVSNIDTVDYFNKKRRIISFEGYFDIFKWIEGIGNTKGLLFYSDEIPGWFQNNLICFIQEGTTYYHYDYYDKCFYQNTSSAKKLKEDYGFKATSEQYEYVFYIDYYYFEKFELFNVDGRLVDQKNYKTTNQLKINKQDYQQGLYFYRLLINNGDNISGKLFID
jgi:hypothetical protein